MSNIIIVSTKSHAGLTGERYGPFLDPDESRIPSRRTRRAMQACGPSAVRLVAVGGSSKTGTGRITPPFGRLMVHRTAAVADVLMRESDGGLSEDVLARRGPTVLV